MASTRNSSLPGELLARTSDCLGRHARRGERLVAALSGGADSVLLLHILHKLSEPHGVHIAALHVNHGLSPNADRWQTFCERLCEAWDIRLEVRRVAVESSGEGLEAAARRARYEIFGEVSAEWLVLAHNRDDQAETLLLNLLRGAGVSGAAAMPVARVFPGRPGLGILRPLLETARGDIEACACMAGLSWVDDESNADIRHSRNFLRHRIIPMMRDRFPGCDTVLARAASLFSESENLLQELARIDAGKAMREGRIISTQLAEMEDHRARNLVRYVLRREGVTLPENARLHEIVRQVCHALPDRHLTFDLGERVLHRFRGEVWLVPHGEAGLDLEWQGEDVLKWGSTMLRFKETTGEGVSRKKLARGCVRISTRKGGERFRPDNGRPRRALKKLLQEHAIPPWERRNLPLLWCGDDLVWVPGIGVDSSWRCAPTEPGILPEYQTGLFTT